MEISRNLAIAVFKKDVVKVKFFLKDNMVTYQTYQEASHTTVDEFIAMCKDWSMQEGIELRTSRRGIVDSYDVAFDNEFIDSHFNKNGELHSVVDVCERFMANIKKRKILDNKENV